MQKTGMDDLKKKWCIDGLKIAAGVGAGIYGQRNKCVLSLGFCSSILLKEILAIERCVNMNLERNYQI